MNLEALYRIAENEKIVLTGNQCISESTIVDFMGQWIIDINYKSISSLQKERQCLAHELGHYYTGFVYSGNCSQIDKSRHEYRADKWTIKALIPKEALKEAVLKGYNEVWELSDYFSVSEDLIKKAFSIYRLNIESKNNV